MSPLLILGLMLLVIVAVLSILQRRAQVDHTARREAPPVAPPAASSGEAAPQRVRGTLQIDDPDLGVLAFNDDRLWEGDSLDFDGVPIITELQGDANGVHPAARAIAVRGRHDARALGARGRAVVAAELTRRGVAADDVEPFELAVDIEEGRPVAFLWYEADAFDGTIGVSSRDGWTTLTLEVVE